MTAHPVTTDELSDRDRLIGALDRVFGAVADTEDMEDAADTILAHGFRRALASAPPQSLTISPEEIHLLDGAITGARNMGREAVNLGSDQVTRDFWAKNTADLMAFRLRLINLAHGPLSV